MSFNLTPRHKLQWSLVGLVIVGIALATLIPWEHAAGTEPGALEKFVEGLGEALAIAGILGLLVDEAAKRDLLKEGAKGLIEKISLHIVGHLHEPILRDAVEQHLKGDLVRTNWTVTYTISNWPGQPAGTEYKQLETESVYDMRNVSYSPRDYLCHYEVEESLFPTIGKARIDSVEWRGQATGSIKTTRGQGRIVFDEVVKLPGREALQFTIRSTELIRNGSIVPFFTTQPVLETFLIIKYPVKLLNVWVDFSSEDVGGGTALLVGEGKQWTLKKPLLPGQGFTVRFAEIAP